MALHSAEFATLGGVGRGRPGGARRGQGHGHDRRRPVAAPGGAGRRSAPRSIPRPNLGPPMAAPLRQRAVDRRGGRRPPAVLHQPRRARLRPGQPARGGQGGPVRPLLPHHEEPAAAVPRRVRRRPRHRPATSRSTPPWASSGPRSSTDKVFFEYGDDSVAQLGGVHLACEQASNLLTKVLEWGRLMAYLEQSTRYIAYDTRLGGRYRYHRDPAVLGVAPRHPLRGRPRPPVRHLRRPRAPDGRPGTGSTFPKRARPTPTSCGGSRSGPRRSTPCGACCRRPSLSNVGHLRHRPGLRGSCCCACGRRPLPEARAYAELMLDELRKVIPSFLTRVDRPERGGEWSAYLAATAGATAEVAARLFAGEEPEPRPAVTLVDFDPEAEDKLLAAMLYPYTDLPDDQVRARVRALSAAEREAVAAAYVGERAQPPPQAGAGPGDARATASTSCPTTAPSATSSATACSPSSGSRSPPATATSCPPTWSTPAWPTASRRPWPARPASTTPWPSPFPAQAALRRGPGLPGPVLDRDERPGGDAHDRAAHRPRRPPEYRRVCQEMHRLIAEEAGHRMVAGMMTLRRPRRASDLERLDAERRAEARRQAPRIRGRAPTGQPSTSGSDRNS